MHGAPTPLQGSDSAAPELRRAPLGGRWLHVALIVACAGYAIGAALGWGSQRLALIMGDFGLSLAALLACASCLWYAFTRAGEFRAAWCLFGLSSLTIGVGNAIWGWYEVILRLPVPRFSVADAVFLLFAPLAIIGLLMLLKRPVSRAGWICLGLDATLIGGSLLIVSWSLALAHTAQWQGDSVPRAALALAYPILDIALVSVVLVLHIRRTSGHCTAINTVIGALALTVLCDALFTSPLFREDYSSGQLLDAGWFAGSLLLASAPWVPQAVRSRLPAGEPVPLLTREPASPLAGEPVRVSHPVPQRAPRRPGALFAPLLPYLAAAVSTVAILLTMVQHRQLDRVVVISACTVVLALLLRQGITLLDNIALAQELAHKESHFRSLVQGSSDVIMIASPDGTLRYVSPAAEGVYGLDAETLIGRRLSELIHPEDIDRVQHELRRFLSPSGAGETSTRTECRVRHGSGDWLHVESSVNRHEMGLIFNSRDVTERVRLQDQLQHSASHDPLTDLPNRVLFTEQVHRAIAGRRESDTDAAVFYIDLDGFKAVNDSAGHQAGDELLVQAARRLRDTVRAQDTTARLGGDEFAVLLVGGVGDVANDTREVRIGDIAERIRVALSAPYCVESVDTGEIRIAASIGVAFAEPGCPPGELLRRADLAMYRAKQTGRNRVEVFRPQHRRSATTPCERANDPPRVGKAGGFNLLHQPVVALASGRVSALSARARWYVPQENGATATELLASELQEPSCGAARSADRVALVVRSVLEEALACAEKRRAADCSLPVGVRVPAAALTGDALAAPAVRDLLTHQSLPPAALVLELTEADVCLARGEVLRRLTDLRALGVGIALDGLGAGPVPVSALSRLPVTEVRLAPELTAGILESRELHIITAGLVRLAAELELTVVADGVEDQGQAEALHAMGVWHGRGGALSPPLDEPALAGVLDAGGVWAPCSHLSPPSEPARWQPAVVPAPAAQASADGTDARPRIAAPRRVAKP